VLGRGAVALGETPKTALPPLRGGAALTPPVLKDLSTAIKPDCEDNMSTKAN
jgi:hypothetical protein